MFLRILAFLGLTTLRLAHQRYCAGVLDEQERHTKRYDAIRLIAIETLMNKKVICISNEWENPLIGTVVGIEFITQAQNPVPIVRCAITGKDILTLSKVMAFTMQRFEALMKLTPYERWCLIDTQNEIPYRTTDKRELPRLHTVEEYIDVLTRKGFLEVKETVES